MKAVGVLTAIALALALQTTLARFLVVGGAVALDLVLVVVVYVALTSGPVTGMLAGSLAGITQDALSIGVIGVGGLAKSAVGFAVGVRIARIHRHRPSMEKVPGGGFRVELQVVPREEQNHRGSSYRHYKETFE